jgi:hypothetical protein
MGRGANKTEIVLYENNRLTVFGIQSAKHATDISDDVWLDAF